MANKALGQLRIKLPELVLALNEKGRMLWLGGREKSGKLVRFWRGHSVQTIAEGKESVLEYLERDSMGRAGEAGVYRLIRDDAGNLVVFLAGHSLLGTGSYSIGGKRVLMLDGLAVQVDQQEAQK